VEQETGGKLLVRGKGSMKDKKVEEEKRGTPNYEHLDEDLHVFIMVEDTDERARLKLKKAVEEVNFLLTPPVSENDFFLLLFNFTYNTYIVYFLTIFCFPAYRKVKMPLRRNNFRISQF